MFLQVRKAATVILKAMPYGGADVTRVLEPRARNGDAARPPWLPGVSRQGGGVQFTS
jgi:hypothetical protein